MRAGYKRTDAGIIPEDWKVNTLGEIGNVRMCKRVLKQQTRSNGDVPFYKIGTFGGVADAYINHSLFEEFKRKYSYPKKGDVLISAAGTIGRSVIFDGSPSYFQDSNIVWIENDESKATNEYLWHCYQVTKWAVSHGGTVARLYNDSLRTKIHVPVPPLSEQRAISQALSDVDALITTLDRLIAKKRDIKQATMQQLLTGKTRLSGFSGKWETKTLGEVASVAKGTQLHSSETNVEGDFPHFNGGMSASSYTDKANTPAETIAISEGGNSCGYVQFIPEPFWCGGHCYAIVPSKVDKRFLYHTLKGSQASIMGLRVGSGLPNVQKSALTAFKIRIPCDSSEQAAIAAVLSDIDDELSALEARRDKTRLLKQGMMQELLTGKTRLI